jgi:hypothetical protein
MWKQYQAEGLDVLVVGLHHGENPELLNNFIEQTGVTYPIIRDNSTLGRFEFPPGVGYPYPRDIVIGKDLTVHSIKSSFNFEEMDNLVRSLLSQ